jgi:hypothetical protein
VSTEPGPLPNQEVEFKLLAHGRLVPAEVEAAARAIGLEVGMAHNVRQIDRYLVVERERADRHASHAADILDHRRRHAFTEHQMAFADVSADHARGVEAAAVVHHNRRLADGAHVIERGGQRLVAGIFAED